MDVHRVKLREVAGRIAGIWAIWSAAILLFSWVIARTTRPVREPWPPEIASQAPPLARWDSGWYYQIAANGYRIDPNEQQNDVAFYPLYPLLTRWLAKLSHAPIFDAGIALSLASLLGGLLFFSSLCAGWGDPPNPSGAVGALLLYPSAFFFAAFYTESLFFLATAAAFWGGRERRWLLCGLAGAAACLTRFNGVLILLPIAWYAWESRGRGGKRWPPIAAVALTAAGAAAFPVYLWRAWGDPLLYFHSHRGSGWNQRAAPVWKLALDAAHNFLYYFRRSETGGVLLTGLAAASLVLFSFLAVQLFRDRMIAEGLYCATTMLILWHAGSLDGIHRYVLALFPCFFLLAQALRRRPVLIALSTAFGVGTGLILLGRYVRWLLAG
jgi:hypothetical protein